MAELELVPVGKLNPKNLVFGIPEEADIKQNNTVTGKYTKCKLEYKNSKGELGGLYMAAPREFCYGVAKDYAFGKEKIDENLKGYQVCLFCSDPSKTAKPATEEQKRFIHDLKTVEKLLSDHLKKNIDFLDEEAHEKVRSGKFVKAIAKHPKKEEPIPGSTRTKKVTDPSKPLRYYAKLLQNKKSGKFVTQFYGPGDVDLDPLKLVDTWGYIEPVIKLEYVYVKNDGANIQVKLFEANFTATESTRKRLIGRNTDPLPSEQSSDPNDDLNNSDDDVPQNDTSDHASDNDDNEPPKKTTQKITSKAVSSKTRARKPVKKAPPPSDDIDDLSE